MAKSARFLADRFKGYSDDHFGWSKEIWDMAPVAWLLDPDWVPTVACADADSDGPSNLERRSDSLTHTLCDNRQT